MENFGLQETAAAFGTAFGRASLAGKVVQRRPCVEH
jgi:hypothetical protein